MPESASISSLLWRRCVPAATRARVRTVLREAPVRLVDALPDLADFFRAAPLPPARLRHRVAGTSSRRSFVRCGAEALAAIEDVVSSAELDSSDFPRWLDFGCGCGRVARHLASAPFVEELTGADLDGEAIAWAAAHLSGTYCAIAPDPPTGFDTGRFDAIYAGSVFTHFAEERQLLWLTELHRLLRPGGILIASTHSPSLVWSRPDLPPAARDALATRGFAFAPGNGPFNEDGAFHSTDYLVSRWGRLFGLRHFRQYGLNGYQDLAVWEKW